MSKRKAEPVPEPANPWTDSDAEEDAALANLTLDAGDENDDDEAGDGSEASGSDEDGSPADDENDDEDDEIDEDEDGDSEPEDGDDESEDEFLSGEEFPSDEEDLEDLEGSEGSEEEQEIVKPVASKGPKVAKAPAKPQRRIRSAEAEVQDDEDSGYSSKERRRKSVSSAETGDQTTSADELPWWRTNPEIEPEYDSDSSTEEQTNTIGNVPLEWYADLPHIGYDVDGKRILKPATPDALDAFLDKMDDPNSWKTFDDPYEGKKVVLSPEELDILRRIQGQEFADGDVDPYEPTIEWYTSKVMETPLQAVPEPKRRFIPSKWEGKRIMKIVRAIRKGWIVPRAPKVPPKPDVYMLWNDTDEVPDQHVMHIPAPKLAPPDHAESYNPPAEYVPTEEEKKEWEQMDPEDRKRNYIPRKHKSLRSVPAYTRLINERFERCLDLYLCPRVRKQKIQMDPEALLPKLPDPKDLQPFPTQLAITYPHGGRVRAISVDPTGRWVVSGGDSGEIKLWEVQTGRCWKTWKAEGIIHSIAWNPNKSVECFAVAIGSSVLLIAPGFENDAIKEATEALFHVENGSDGGTGVVWAKPSASEAQDGIKCVLKFTRKVSTVVWHRKGDYFAALTPDAPNSPISVHQLSKRQSQSPFRKSKGTVQKMLFHPSKPFLFVATQRFVRVYDLMKQELHKTLQSGVKWISSMDVHPGGDNVIIGSFDKRVCWFDMDLSSKPYRVLRSHDTAVRGVSYHKRYPLFASCADDGTVQVFHGMVYNDLMQNPLIVPVKVLRGHEVTDGLGVLGIEFHPVQPWVLSCGADGTVRLFS